MDAHPPLLHPRRLRTRRAAFSLVEVTLAIGIVAFALVPMIGLLSVGLKSYQNSNMRGPAAQAVNRIASCLRAATVSNGTYTAAHPFESVTWTTDGTAPPSATTNPPSYPFYLDESGEITTNTTGSKPARMVAMLVFKSPNYSSGNFAPGTALIAVAWPPVGKPTYTTGTPAGTIGQVSFVNPQGHEESTVFITPN